MFEKLIKFTSNNPKQIAKMAVNQLREFIIQTNRLTAEQRALPNFLIIGAQKSGTTSLYKYLMRHPAVSPAFKKEIHFFSVPERYNQGELAYRMYFPMEGRLAPVDRITGEATPTYLLHPLVPQRVHEMMPHVKLLVVLRNPVWRTYSHYQHMVRNGRETLSFKDALQYEREHYADEVDRMAADPQYYNLDFWVRSYVTRSLYAAQLERWLKYFPREQLMVLSSEALFTDPASQLKLVTDFLGIESIDFTQRPMTQFNSGNYDADQFSAELQAELRDMFAPHNQKLYRLVGQDFGWDRGTGSPA